MPTGHFSSGSLVPRAGSPCIVLPFGGGGPWRGDTSLRNAAVPSRPAPPRPARDAGPAARDCAAPFGRRHEPSVARRPQRGDPGGGGAVLAYRRSTVRLKRGPACRGGGVSAPAKANTRSVVVSSLQLLLLCPDGRVKSPTVIKRHHVQYESIELQRALRAYIPVEIRHTAYCAFGHEYASLSPQTA
jgi:hypothetical protein